MKVIRKDEFNQRLRRSSVRFRPFQVAKVSQTATYVYSTLALFAPDAVIIHPGK